MLVMVPAGAHPNPNRTKPARKHERSKGHRDVGSAGSFRGRRRARKRRGVFGRGVTVNRGTEGRVHVGPFISQSPTVNTRSVPLFTRASSAAARSRKCCPEHTAPPCSRRRHRERRPVRAALSRTPASYREAVFQARTSQSTCPKPAAISLQLTKSRRAKHPPAS